MSEVDQKTVITLKGSVAVVSEFFYTAINSILYQRGIYQPETFKRESKYGLTVLTSTDEGLLSYLNQIMSQMETWLLDGDVQRLVVVVTGVDSGETLERWQFNVTVEDKNGVGSSTGADENAATKNIKRPTKSQTKMGKSLKEIHNEIQAIVRQITASVSTTSQILRFFHNGIYLYGFGLYYSAEYAISSTIFFLFDALFHLVSVFQVTFLPLLNEPCSFDLLVYTNKAAIVPKKWEDSDPQYIMNSQEVKLRSFTTSVHKVDSLVTYKEADEWEL